MIFLALLRNAASALALIAGKSAILFGNSLFYVGTRMIIAGSFLLLFYFSILKRRCWLVGKDFWYILQIVVFQIYLTYICDIYAISKLSAARASLLFNMSPFVAAFFSYIYFSEVMTPKKWIGLCLGFVGLLPMLLLGSQDNAGIGFISFAGLASAIAVVANVYGYVILRFLVKERKYPVVLISGIGMFFGGLLSFITAVISERSFDLVYVWKPFTIFLFLSIITGSVISYNLHGYLLRKYTATLLSFIGLTYSLFGALFGWLLFGERITWNFFVSIIIISGGLYIFYMEEWRQGYIVTD